MTKTTATFLLAGVTSKNGETKVRFANDVARVKVLVKCGHDDIDLRELPGAMMKPEAVTFLMANRNSFMTAATLAIEDANDKYNPEKVAGVAAPKKAKKAKTTTVTVKPGEVKVTTAATSDQDKKDARNARRRELRAAKKAEADAALMMAE